MKQLRVVFAGFGNVSREVARLFLEKSERFARLGLCPIVVGVATGSHGALYSRDGIDVVTLLGDSGRSLLKRSTVSTREFIDTAAADVLIETTPLNVFSGEPAISHVTSALTSGKHVVLANKGPIAWDYERLSHLAQQNGKRLLFESTVMDGTPVFNMVRCSLAGARVLGFEGVLNSTTNYILDCMERGQTNVEAVAEAQRQGFAEADPSLDVEGWDAAAKVAALANVLLQARTNPLRVQREGISGVTREQLLSARERGNRIRLVCRGRLSGSGSVKTRVGPEEVPAASLMGQVSGTSSVLTLYTDLMGSLSVYERDPGITETAYGVINDLIEISRGENV